MMKNENDKMNHEINDNKINESKNDANNEIAPNTVNKNDEKKEEEIKDNINPQKQEKQTDSETLDKFDHPLEENPLNLSYNKEEIKNKNKMNKINNINDGKKRKEIQ